MSGHRGTIILGHPRSGTTLLRRLLTAHPNLVSPPETHLFGACARFLDSEETADGVDMGVLAGLHFAGFSDDDVIGRLRDLAFGIMDDIAERADKPRWVEKTAFDIFGLDGIERLCGDDVQYVGILRHPLDVAVSCRDFCAAMGGYPQTLHTYVARYPQPIEAFVRSWIDTTEALIDLGERRPGQVLICRYEDLVGAPDDTLADILGFLGESDDVGFAADALSGMDDLGFSDHKSYQVDTVHQNSVRRWSAVPSAQLERLGPLLDPYLERCGYDPIPSGPPTSVEDRRSRYVASLGIHAAKRSAP